MLLVRCAYCHGSGKQKCLCRSHDRPVQDDGDLKDSGAEIENVQAVLRPMEDEDLSVYSCSLCRDSGWVTCPGCCGSGFVEMPALA